MTSTEILKTEHRAIEVMLECLARTAKQAEQSGQLDTTSAAQAIGLMTRFVEARHHGKEERVFFESLVTKGWPRNEGPIAVMLADHSEGRALMRKALIACDATERGLENCAADFARAAESYVNLLRGHIRREDLILFPRADGALSADDQVAIVSAFERIDAQQQCAGACVLELARELAERLGVSAEPFSALHCHCRRS
jgi:hemerythrin-like domain-containing protein